MIYNRSGAQFVYQGITYTIGGKVYANSESVYEGLYGVIREIRTDEDLETDHDTPDIYCDFMPPILPDDIKMIEDRFSSFWGTEKAIDELDLDMVIMVPDMLSVLDPLAAAPKLEIFLVREDWAIDDDYGTSTQIVADYHLAKFHFNNLIFQEMLDGCIQKWAHRKDLETDTRKDFYECWLHDEYYENHYKVTIERAELSLPILQFQQLGKAYLDRSRRNDLAAQIEDWEELEDLTEDEYLKFISDPGIPERIQTHLSKNDSYWESYWESISECAFQLLREYRRQIGKADCFSPEPNNLYPLCVGNGSKECLKCCVYKDMQSEGGS